MTGLSFKRKSVETPRHRTAWIEAGPEHGQMAAFKLGNIDKEPTALLDAAKTMAKGPLVAEPIVPHAQEPGRPVGRIVAMDVQISPAPPPGTSMWRKRGSGGTGATLRHVASTRIPTKWGVFQLLGFDREASNGCTESALAMILGDLAGCVPLVRVHSQCFTSEVLGSLRCDCKDQLEIAMQTIAAEGRGLVIYEYQEGRGIGLMAKLQAYALQDAGLDTVEANHELGFAADCRDFSLPAAILQEIGVTQIRLLSNNPKKARALADAGIKIVAQVPCQAAPNPHSFAYLRAKQEKMGHLLSLRRSSGPRMRRTRPPNVKSRQGTKPVPTSE